MINKITVFTGPKFKFRELIPQKYTSLTELAMILDNESKRFKLILPNESEKTEAEEKIPCENLVIDSDEYAGVSNHVITNFCNFLSRIDVKNIYLQNPPEVLKIQINNLKGVCEKISEEKYQYNTINEDEVKDIFSDFSENIIGQEVVKQELLVSLFSYARQEGKKPLVILFYGESGIGKTETAKYLCKIHNENIFRKQFSMLQNSQSLNYIYGGQFSESSLAKDLLDRESNIILFDEFDKANPTFHNAFYEMFDEGIFRDINYRVNVEKSIIICTSNYQSHTDIIKNLGPAITSRFDKIIHFAELDFASKKRIIDKYFNCELQNLKSEEIECVSKHDLQEKMYNYISKLKNVRDIKRLVKETIYTVLWNNFHN